MAIRDEDFFIDTMIIIRVEDRLFKVPQHVLTANSPIFRGMFTVPIPEDCKPDGSEEQPLVLEGIKASDFARFIRFIYPIEFREKSFKFHFSIEEWEVILKLATFYDMTKVRTFVIEVMTPLLKRQPALQVQLSKAHSVSSWLEQGLLTLVKREETLSAHDIEVIGAVHAAKVMMQRELDYDDDDDDD
ncbi:hypothetical protein APHAL10511_005126 [Amanita phalloides]|nr:hypothetical protein APHAL10511_005126 [Amanita phalloides]